MRFGAPTPILRSFDEAKAREFYIDFLGFEVDFEYGGGGGPLYLSVKRGDCILHLTEHYGDCSPGAQVRIPATNLMPICKRCATSATNTRTPVIRLKSPGGCLRFRSAIHLATA